MSTSSIGTCFAISILVIVPAFGACTHSASPASDAHTLPAASAGAPELRSAIKDIVNARCDLEERCNNVAPGKKFDNRDICESKMDGTTADHLNMKDCPHGVDQAKLSTCIADIKAEDCGNPFDSLSRWNACRTGQVCLSE